MRSQFHKSVALAAGALASSLLLTPVSQAGQGAVPALYATQAEAEKAAKLHFHCSGAHKMGNQWMPCASHGTPADAHPSGSRP